MTLSNNQTPPVQESLNILIVDDEPSICSSLAGALSDEGHVVKTAANGKLGLIDFKLSTPDLVFLDIWMPELGGIETLQAMREINSSIPIIIMSGHATIETAVKATKLGAFEVLEKPLELERLLGIVDSIIRQRLNESSVSSKVSALELSGTSPFVVQMRKQISMVGPRNASVLITGENGTGKEIVARMIHQASPRSNAPFIAINCAAIPDELIESELFGHEKGSFTGAIHARKGKFEQAHRGTLFLDEIGDMSLRTQAKILRVLQERVCERLGGTHTYEVDVRIIAATNKDLQEEIKSGRFREDLYYRLNVVPLRMTPIRERREDILPLANSFLAKLRDESGSQVSLSEFAEKMLVAHDWPGNVRELKNAIERAVILSNGQTVSAADFTWLGQSQTSDQSAKEASTLRQAKTDFERTYIIAKLEESDWNVTKAAETLGIERSNLHRKLRSFDIDPKKLKG
jgi:two-component system nitrogen regulation response regulator NtrX